MPEPRTRAVNDKRTPVPKGSVTRSCFNEAHHMRRRRAPFVLIVWTPGGIFMDTVWRPNRYKVWYVEVPVTSLTLQFVLFFVTGVFSKIREWWYLRPSTSGVPFIIVHIFAFMKLAIWHWLTCPQTKTKDRKHGSRTVSQYTGPRSPYTQRVNISVIDHAMGAPL